MHVRELHRAGAPRGLRPPLVRHRLCHVRVRDAEGAADRCGERAPVEQHCELRRVRREDSGQEWVVRDEDCARGTCGQRWWEFAGGGGGASGDRGVEWIWWSGLMGVREGGAIGLYGAQDRLARLESEYAHVLVKAADI